MSMSMRSVTYLFVAACALCGDSALVRGFQTTSIFRSPRPRYHGSLLRVAVDVIGASGAAPKNKDATIRRIDQKIQNYVRTQPKHGAQSDKANAELEKFQRTRRPCLEGATLASGPDADVRFSETAARSLAKAMLWRAVAGGVTFLTSLRFSGSVAVALSIVASDFFSKAATMFAGERLMNRSQAGRHGGGDVVGRSLAKALLWRTFAIANTLTTSCLIAKDLGMASKIAGSDAAFKTGLMFAYERAWARTEWGKEHQSEFSTRGGRAAGTALEEREDFGRLQPPIGISDEDLDRYCLEEMWVRTDLFGKLIVSMREWTARYPEERTGTLA